MRRKVSTQLDEVLFRRARLEAVRQGRQINAIIGDALARYLDESGTPGGPGGVVGSSFGALRTPAAGVARVMDEQDDFLGS